MTKLERLNGVEERNLRKIEGLKFLSRHLNNFCVDCVFVEFPQELNPERLDSQPGRVWRVRSGRRFGSELGTPQITLRTVKEVREFVRRCSENEPALEFVIHPVNDKFFEPSFVGTIALRGGEVPSIMLEFQQVDTGKVLGMDQGGKRPRDWEIVLNLEFEYGLFSPKIKYSRLSQQEIGGLGRVIYSLWSIARELDNILSEQGYLGESVARFNIYLPEEILLDDLRSVATFRK